VFVLKSPKRQNASAFLGVWSDARAISRGAIFALEYGQRGVGCLTGRMVDRLSGSAGKTSAFARSGAASAVLPFDRLLTRQSAQVRRGTRSYGSNYACNFYCA